MHVLGWSGVARKFHLVSETAFPGYLVLESIKDLLLQGTRGIHVGSQMSWKLSCYWCANGRSSDQVVCSGAPGQKVGSATVPDLLYYPA